MKKITSILILLLSFAALAQTPIVYKNTQGNCDAAIEPASIGGGRQCSANNDWTVAVDLIVPADNNLTLNSITPSFGMPSGVTATSVKVTIYNNANGLPGSTIGSSQTVVPTSATYKGSQFGMDFAEVLLELNPISLLGSAGSEARYWIALQISTSNNTDGYMEYTSESAIGYPMAFSSGAGFIIPDETKDGVYSLSADCEPMSGDVFPAPYCGPIVFGTVEPITRVEVAGIDNTSSAAVNGSPAHQDFVAISGEMEQGNTYPISIEGNTVGEYINQVVVFIDWNQNGILDDDGEVYIIGDGLSNTTGTDGGNVTDTIEVPLDAVLGTTRMRVKKTFQGPHLDPCDSGANWGQAEDYSMEVTESLNVDQYDAFVGFSYYPNPARNVVHLNSAKNIESVAMYNLLGQKVLEANLGSTASELDVSALAVGTYVLKVTVDGQIGTYKLIKE